ncbi:uridylate kinase [Dethiosulfovibrio peptidovorans]|uniref:amino acid kinase family protein n=1 Tax=Dethiosulfovibrio peptidovorans TaxID=47055 RepID=UPI0005904EC1
MRLNFKGVVKIGGARGNDPMPLLRELSERAALGEKWLLVHGGSGKMEELCLSSGIEPKYVYSPSGFRSRFTGKREMALFEGACSSVSIDLVSSLWSMGIPACPVWPSDGSGATAKAKDALRSVEDGRVMVLRGNRSGSVRRFFGDAVDATWRARAIPVMPPLAVDEDNGGLLNVDGDRLAALAAASLDASVLVILSNVPGVLKDVEDPSSLMRSGTLEELLSLSKGNMKRKMVAVQEALEGGVEKVILSDSRVESPLSGALEGRGTTICRACTAEED